jgi:hypothetical protein
MTPLSAEQVTQILQAQQGVVEILKRRFSNMTTEETTKLAGEIALRVVVELAK